MSFGDEKIDNSPILCYGRGSYYYMEQDIIDNLTYSDPETAQQ